jgi:hypothetical protein
VTLHFEITGKFDAEADCSKLLYAPLALALTQRQTQCYTLDYEGNTEALRAFVNQVLVDAISQDLHEGDAPLFPEAKFVLEYGMKGGALDLEKEAILQYYRQLESPGFSLEKLVLRRRVYVFGTGADPAPFVRDVVNPAIHTSRVIELAA